MCVGTSFESCGVAIEEVEEHEPSEVDRMPQQTRDQPPHLATHTHWEDGERRPEAHLKFGEDEF